MKFVIAAVLAAGIVARGALAQGAPGNPVAVTAFAGPAKVIGLTGDDLKWGYAVGGALDFKFAESRYAVRGELVYSTFDFRPGVVSISNPKFTDVGINIDAVSWAPTESASDARPYVTLGPSFSRLTSSGSLGGVTAASTQSHYGFNVGIGFDKPVGPIAYRVDVRFRQLSLKGDPYKSIPITFGLQF